MLAQKISLVFQMVLIPLHAVAKCGIASGHPAFMGGLSPAPGRGKRGVTRHFSYSSIIKDYFKTLISHNRRAMLAPSLLQCQSSPISFLRAVKRENVSYIVTRAYKIPAETACISQSATLHSTGNISAEGSVHKNKAGHKAHVEQ